jgi:hypothetical protein
MPTYWIASGRSLYLSSLLDNGLIAADATPLIA